MSPVLHGGLLADPARGLVTQADLGVAGGRIGGVPADDGERLDVSGCVVMPGNVCAHHHLYSTLARGMPGPSRPPRNFIETLELIWWRLDRALDDESIRLSALLGAVEAARAGTTSIVDHHASPSAIDGSLDLVADAVQEAGLRAVVCYEVTDRHGQEGGRAGVAENARFLRTNPRPLVRGMAGGHASFTIGPATLDALVGAARDLGAPLHMHLAEDGCDQHDSLERYGSRVVHRLVRAGALEEGDLVAHGVHLDDSEIGALVTSGAWVAHNPRSNMNNGVGYARAGSLGERVALGTDGLDGDMFAETRACYLKARESNLATGPEWAQRRLSAGAGLVASVFGEPALGSLEAGAPADLIVLDPHLPTPFSEANLAGHLMFGMNASHVRDVMVAGRWVVRDRRHLLIDEASLAAEARGAAPELWRRIASGSGPEPLNL
ncbi:MAG: amidohydrolase family protein [Actinomycetota bacterium]|nr:amidohydrolase family protein [Actinomycetota bacterium]